MKKMTGEIIKILPLTKSVNGNSYIRVEFKLSNGKWAKTDICPDYRNYQRWKNIIKVGNNLDNLILKNNDTIDADSFPEILKTADEKAMELCQRLQL